MREVLERNGMPQPDEVESGFGCIRLFFHETKTVVVVDIDEDSDGDEDTEDVDLGEFDDLREEQEDRGPPFMTFPFPGHEQRN